MMFGYTKKQVGKIIDTLDYLISGECTDTPMDYVEEIEGASGLLRGMLATAFSSTYNPDVCYECTGYGDDYYLDENGELKCACDDCWNNPTNTDYED